MVSSIKKFFEIEERGSTIGKEVSGGIVTLLAAVYIVTVQPMIMSAAGMDPAMVFTSTAITAGIATLIMAFLGKLPIMLASGMGINAFVAYTVCLTLGFTWQTAIAATFVNGILFVIISVTGIREQMIKGIPDQLKKAVAIGIGMFIAIIGLQNAGILNAGGATPLAINPITSGSPLLAVIGFALMLILYSYKVPGSILIAIIATTVIGIPMGITTIPEGFSIIGLPARPYLPMDIISGLNSVNFMQFIIVVISLLFVDMFDTIATFAGLAEQSGLKDKDGNILNCKKGLLSDAISTVTGSMFGGTTVTSYIESATGMATGARTGLASVVTGFGFFLVLIFAPFFSIIPAAAVAPCLLFVGFLMLGAISNMDLKDITVGLPTFVTMLMITASYSISKGLAWGFVSYILVMVFSKRHKEIKIPTWILGGIFLFYLFFSIV